MVVLRTGFGSASDSFTKLGEPTETSDATNQPNL